MNLHLIVCKLLLLVFLNFISKSSANPDAKRLYDDLLSNYNRLIRPVSNNTETVLVKLGLRLSQLIDLVSIWLVVFLIGSHDNSLAFPVNFACRGFYEKVDHKDCC